MKATTTSTTTTIVVAVTSSTTPSLTNFLSPTLFVLSLLAAFYPVNRFLGFGFIDHSFEEIQVYELSMNLGRLLCEGDGLKPHQSSHFL